MFWFPCTFVVVCFLVLIGTRRTLGCSNGFFACERGGEVVFLLGGGGRGEGNGD